MLITEYSSMPALPDVESVEIDRCPGLQEVSNLPSSVTAVMILNCPDLESVFLSTSVQSLVISNCPKVRYVNYRPRDTEIIP